MGLWTDLVDISGNVDIMEGFLKIFMEISFVSF